MMKTLQNVAMTLLALLSLSACTHNNGDIGIWFGTWMVEQITNEQTGQQAQYDGTLVMQFQGDVATIRQTTTNHDELVDYGTWQHEADRLTITFPDPDVAYDHVLEQVLGVPLGQQYAFTVLHSDAKRLTLSLTDHNGQPWQLRLRKH